MGALPPYPRSCGRLYFTNRNILRFLLKKEPKTTYYFSFGKRKVAKEKCCFFETRLLVDHIILLRKKVDLRSTRSDQSSRIAPKGAILSSFSDYFLISLVLVVVLHFVLPSSKSSTKTPFSFFEWYFVESF